MRRILFLSFVIAVVLGVATSALLYRALTPTLEGGAGGTSAIVARMGKPVSVGVGIWSEEEVEIDHVEIVGLAHARGAVWTYPRGTFGTCLCEPSGPRAAPARGATVGGPHGGTLDLVVTIHPDAPGTYRIGDLRVTYGHGITRRTTTLDVDACAYVDVPLARHCDGDRQPVFEPADATVAPSTSRGN